MATEKTPLETHIETCLLKLEDVIGTYKISNPASADFNEAKKGEFFTLMQNTLQAAMDEAPEGVALDKLYKQLQMKFHPDRFARQLALANSISAYLQDTGLLAELQRAITASKDYVPEPLPDFWKEPMQWMRRVQILYSCLQAYRDPDVAEAMGIQADPAMAKRFKKNFRRMAPTLAFILSMSHGLDKYPQPVKFIVNFLSSMPINIVLGILAGAVFLGFSIVSTILTLPQRMVTALFNVLAGNRFNHLMDQALDAKRAELMGDDPDALFRMALKAFETAAPDQKGAITVEQIKNSCEILEQLPPDALAELESTSKFLDMMKDYPVNTVDDMLKRQHYPEFQACLPPDEKDKYAFEDFKNLIALLSIKALVDNEKAQIDQTVEQEKVQFARIMDVTLSAMYRSLTTIPAENKAWFFVSWLPRALLLAPLALMTGIFQLTQSVLKQVMIASLAIVAAIKVVSLFALNLPRLLAKLPKKLQAAWRERATFPGFIGNLLYEKRFVIPGNLLLITAAVGVGMVIFGLNPLMLGVIVGTSAITSLILTHEIFGQYPKTTLSLSALVFLAAAALAFFAFGPMFFPSVAEWLPHLPQLVLPFSVPIQAAIAAAGALALVVLPTFLTNVIVDLTVVSTPSGDGAQAGGKKEDNAPGGLAWTGEFSAGPPAADPSFRPVLTRGSDVADDAGVSAPASENCCFMQ